MKIKRYFAADMRQAIRMVREEQGPDAVILSNRKVDGGIEIIAAIDYDEALVNEAMGKASNTAAPSAPAAQSAPRPAAAPAANKPTANKGTIMIIFLMFIIYYNLKQKIILGIIITNVFNYLSQPGFVIRQISSFHIVPDQVAQDPAEIFVPGIRKQTA